ncbi:hypothetical protein HPP92_009233 [Vanilla planifolia]|uniref:Serine/threonine-protein kinase PRP4 homolog n=1 Tax=Vanilla planifolia TaxID=51239 RepID=A0A835RB56_VANPL|nr:hypothetical protein HPP92_009233 [Vanilla planifolia]
MAEDQQSPASSRGKHRRSLDDGSNDEPKRRKHNHRREHHRSKHERYHSDEEKVPIGVGEKVEADSLLKPFYEDLEEGEILEEEDVRTEVCVDGEAHGLAVGSDSEVESGEIKTKAFASLTHKEALCEEDSFPEHNFKYPYIEKDKDTLKSRAEEYDKGLVLFETTLNSRSRVNENGNFAKNEARSFINAPNNVKNIDMGHNNFGRDDSRSPDSTESAYLLKNLEKDDHLSRYSDCTAGEVKPKPRLECNEDDERDQFSNNKGVSPKKPRETYRELRCSSSPSKQYRELGDRNKSLSDEYMTGRFHDRLGESDAEVGSSKGRSERHVKRRNKADHDRSSDHESLEGYNRRRQEVNKEVHKERASSIYSVEDGHDNRHKGRDRTSEGFDRRHVSHDSRKETERHSSGYRLRDGAQDDKVVLSDREKSHNSTRYDGKESRHGSRDREGGKYKDREKYSRRDKERDEERYRSRSRFREDERFRKEKNEIERERDRTNRDDNLSKDGKARSLKDRDHVDVMERVSNGDHYKHRDTRHSKHDDVEHHKSKTKHNGLAKGVSVSIQDSAEDEKNSLREEDEDDYQGRIEQQLAMQNEEDVEKIKEESRKQRLAILEKYKHQQKQQITENSANAHENEELKEKDGLREKDGMQQQLPSKDFGSGNTGPEEVVHQPDSTDAFVVQPSFSVHKSPVQNGFSVSEKNIAGGGLGDGTPKSEKSTDMFCDDIFGESPAGTRKLGKDDMVKIDRGGLHDNWDDNEGYYNYRLGEVLDGRYEVIAAHGKGVFSTVVRAKDLKAGKDDPEEVAIKIIRSNDTMYKAGMEELVILKKLAGADPEDKRHCVRFLSSFKYRNHLCLVFESLHMNLREVLKKFGRNIGLRLTAVRAYAKQLFIALKHLRNCGVLHCDIKPDNMLVNEAKNVLKLCDFGNAMFAGKNEITPYLVSRFYRAPEIILGLQYDHPLDIWSVGCCLFELYTGKVLFPGPSNNDMLRLHMELKGPFPKKMLRKAAFADQHFDQDLNFHASEEDPVTKKTVKRLLFNIKPKDIGTLISGSSVEDPKMLANFKDLLDRIFVLDPEKRMTVSQALSHPFITALMHWLSIWIQFRLHSTDKPR